MFDVALYTDTRANEAIDGIDGFNFQAISEGMNAQDRQVIRDTMLHRVVVGWNADHDPLEHPPSFAYCEHAGRYYLSRGISTGLTNNGRPGNLLTQAIATCDPDDFGMMRPAQLFGALNWCLEKAPGQMIDRWPSPLAIAPDYQADALRDMVRADGWAVEHFAQFLTMVEEVTADNPKRLVLITADEAVATRWIALGTLFVDSTRALSLSIRGLVPDPMTTKADIVAASPAFGPQPDPTVVRAGVTIIDLDRRILTPVTPTESALTQADWFLHEDPADALAAIEVARRWEEFLGRDLATRAAALASLTKERGNAGDWATVMEALRGLAQAGQGEELFFYGDPLLDVAVTCAVATPADAQAAGAAVVALLATDSHDLAVGVLMSALESSRDVPGASEALISALAAAPVQVCLQWEDDDARRQAGVLLTQAAQRCPTELLPVVASVIRTLDTPLVAADRVDVVNRLAHAWAAHPDMGRDRERWADGDEIDQALAEELLRRWRGGAPGDLSLLSRGTWEWLGQCSGLEPATRRTVEAWHEAVRIASLPVNERAEQLSSVGKLPPDSWRLVWNCVELPNDCALIEAWAQTQRELTGAACQWLLHQVSAVLAAREPAIPLRQLLTGLYLARVVMKDERLVTYVAQVYATEQCCRQVIGDPREGNPHLSTFMSSVPAMSELMADYFGWVILTCADTSAVTRMVAADEEWARRCAHVALTGQASTRRGLAQAVTLAMSVRCSCLIPARAQGAEDFLIDVCDDRALRNEVRQAAKDGLIDAVSSAAFETFAAEAKKGRLKRRLGRATAGLLGGRGRGAR